MHKKIFSPFRISLLLHFHLNDTPFEIEGRLCGQVTIEEFVEDGIITLIYGKTNCYELTEKGRAWVQSLCDVEIPQVAYTDKSGELIKIT